MNKDCYYNYYCIYFSAINFPEVNAETRSPYMITRNNKNNMVYTLYTHYTVIKTVM